MSDDLPRYWTPKFVEAFVNAVNNDEEFQNTAGSFSENVQLRCLDSPDGEDISATYTFNDGQIVDVDLWIDDAPSDQMRDEPVDKSELMARVTAPYDVWVKMDKGEMSATDVLSSSDYQIEGAMMSIMSNMGVFRNLNKVAAHVEKTY